ncbi:hypothetical protein Hte_005182 [Hypoxylon texense]
MTSYTAERETESIPGAFPVTPGEPDATLAFGGPNQRNKLHKPEDPRGWSEEQKASRGHQYTDSGVGLTDTSRTPHSQTRDSTISGGNYDSNKDAVSQNRGTVPSTTATATSGTTDYRGVDSKPGVMTGAYSRLDNSSTDNQYPQSISQDPSNKHHANTTGVGAVGPATGIATSASSTNTADNESNNSVRNIVRNGLRQSSDLDHTDPYWGDVPHGTGVYNGVTGHGSSETPVDGSIQARDSQLSHDQQRAFPLSTSDAHTRDESSPRSSSRFREGLAETGAGVGAGVGASELAEKHSERKHEKEAKEPTTQKHESTEPKKESKIASLFHRDHKDEDTKYEKKHEAKEEKKLAERGPAKDDKPLTDRDAGAALAAATMAYGAKDQHDKKYNESGNRHGESNTDAIYNHPNAKVADRSATGTTTQSQASDPFIAAGYTGIINQQPSTTAGNTHPTSGNATTRDHSHTSQTAEKPTQHNDSRAGYGLAAAGAGAGAGYAAHKYASRDDDTYKESVSEPNYNNQHTSSKTAPQQADTGYTIGQPRLAVMPGSTGTAHSLDRQAVPSANRSVNPSQTGATRNDKYNTLSDGTPSGIDVGNHYGDKKNVVPSSTSSSTTSNTTPKESHSGAKATAAGAGVGAAGAGAAAYYSGKKNSDMSTIPEVHQPVVPSSKEVREPYMEGATTRNTTTSTQGGQYKSLPTGTPSGVNVDDSRYRKPAGATTSSPSTTSRDVSNDDTHNHRGAKAAAVAGVAGTGAAAAAHHRDSERSEGVAASDFATGKSAAAPRTADTSVPDSVRKSTDSSHGGQYNVLSSGTPSGINIGDHHHGGAKNTTSSATAAPTGTTARSVQPSAIQPAAASTTQKSSVAKPAAAATGAGAVAAAAASGPSKSSGDKVFHRCKKCGEENDITGYFQDKKH